MGSKGRNVLAGLLTVGVLLAAGCGDDGSGPEASIDGTYELISMNGNSLPYVFIDNGEGQERINSGSVTLSGRNFTLASSTSSNYGSGWEDDTWSDSGTFILSGNSLTLYYSDGDTSTEVGEQWTWDGGDLISMTHGLRAFVFRR
jgi:hypothetical protein